MRVLLKVVIVVLAVALVLVLTAVLAGPDKRRLDDAVRATSAADFAELSEGLVEYEVAGPEDGTPIILVHGFSVPMYDWDRQFTGLAAQGFRVLRYNQYGRGLSDRPRGQYDLNRYVRQLKELVDMMQWDQVNLVAHSMGGVVAAGFAAQYPAMVHRMVLVSPALHIAHGNSGIALVRIPVIGDFAAKVVLPRILVDRAASLFEAAQIPEAAGYADRFREQMTYRGFTRSVKSLFRGDVVADQSSVYNSLDARRILLIRGTEDECVPEAHFEALAEMLHGMEQVALEGIGHMPNMQDAELVNELIIDFVLR